MFLTLAEAKRLQTGTTLYSTIHRNADGSPQRWRVTGKVQRWKRDPDRIRVPLKNGFHNNYDAIETADFTTEVTAGSLVVRMYNLLSLDEAFARACLDHPTSQSATPRG